MSNNGDEKSEEPVVEGANEEDKLVTKEEEKSVSKPNPIFYLLTESILVVGGIPTVLFFIVGIINGFLLLIEQHNYLICIAKEKYANVLAGKSQDDVSDMIEWHLIGSTIVAWTLIVLYTQILFIVIPQVYKWSGVVYAVVFVLCLAFHCVAPVWIANNE